MKQDTDRSGQGIIPCQLQLSLLLGFGQEGEERWISSFCWKVLLTEVNTPRLLLQEGKGRQKEDACPFPLRTNNFRGSFHSYAHASEKGYIPSAPTSFSHALNQGYLQLQFSMKLLGRWGYESSSTWLSLTQRTVEFGTGWEGRVIKDAENSDTNAMPGQYGCHLAGSGGHSPTFPLHSRRKMAMDQHCMYHNVTSSETPEVMSQPPPNIIRILQISIVFTIKIWEFLEHHRMVVMSLPDFCWKWCCNAEDASFLPWGA